MLRLENVRHTKRVIELYIGLIRNVYDIIDNIVSKSINDKSYTKIFINELSM